MTASERFSQYFNLSDLEVDRLYDIYQQTTEKNNFTRDDLPLLFAGEAVPSDIYEYAAVSMQLETKDEIYPAMVVYGLLTYKDGFVSIPNDDRFRQSVISFPEPVIL